MTPAQQAVIDELRCEGHMVVIWTPEELGEDWTAADDEHLEDLVISYGNDFIEAVQKNPEGGY